jgi:O-antigen/teichoic acid export membrane protein
MRANRLGTVARISTVQLVADNALTAALAMIGLGAWAVVLPKLLTAPLWVVGMRRAGSWSPDRAVTPAPAAELVRFAAPVLGSELLAAARLNLDKMIVAAVLGLEVLGVYYFAFNAGLGLSLSLTTALTASVYPALAALSAHRGDMLARFDSILWRNALPVSLIIALQAAAALIYVPIVFGEKWADTAPLVALLCVSALTRPVWDAAAQLLRAAGLPGYELAGAVVYTVVYLGAFAALLPLGLQAGISAVAIVALLLNVGLAILARKIVRRQIQRSSAAPDDGHLMRAALSVTR